MASRCEQCGAEEYMPYACKFCKGKYCAAHRLPENHDCQGLGAYRERMRAEGRVMAPDPAGAPVRPTVARSARAGASMEAFWSLVDQKMTFVLLGTIVAVYLLEWAVAAASVPLFYDHFTLQKDFFLRPWTILTSIFSHDITRFNHILVNSLVLLFFGTTTERLIGTRRFTWLFLVAGVVAGLAQVAFSYILQPTSEVYVLGASGAIQGIMGTLVVLAPRLTVLVFFIIPAPLWALTALFVLYDLMFNVFGESGTAGVAHLAGLAIGIWYGFQLRQQGLRAQHQPPPQMRRYF